MKIIDNILELLYPTKCMFCHKITGSSNIRICDSCLKSIEYTGKDNEQKFPELDWCRSPLYYSGLSRESLRRYKFGGNKFYGPEYAKIILKNIDLNQNSCDIISWVPISRKRLRQRRFDQSQIIALALADVLMSDCRQVLIKNKNNKAQSSIGGRSNRRLNVMGVYSCTDPQIIQGKTILLVDDIVTTGATLSECAATLKSAGAKAVCAVTVARSTIQNK